MDTRFWGRDGWKLLHSIAYSYNKVINEVMNDVINDKDIYKHYKTFFKSIQYVLPCIYCRRSYKKYITEHPFPKELTQKELTRWLYIIHNCVNDKLRKQEYAIESDSSLKEVDKYYENYVKKIHCMIGFDFIYCILFNYDHTTVSDCRKKGYVQFFDSLQYILPNDKIRKIYQEFLKRYPIEECVYSKSSSPSQNELGCPKLKRWGYKLEKTMKEKCCSYKERCEKIEKYRVNKCVGETCRIKKASPQKMRKKSL